MWALEDLTPSQRGLQTQPHTSHLARLLWGPLPNRKEEAVLAKEL